MPSVRIAPLGAGPEPKAGRSPRWPSANEDAPATLQKAGNTSSPVPCVTGAVAAGRRSRDVRLGKRGLLQPPCNHVRALAISPSETAIYVASRNAERKLNSRRRSGHGPGKATPSMNARNPIVGLVMGRRGPRRQKSSGAVPPSASTQCRRPRA